MNDIEKIAEKIADTVFPRKYSMDRKSYTRDARYEELFDALIEFSTEIKRQSGVIIK